MTTSIQRRVRNIAISLAHKTGEDVDDLTQEGLIAAWQAAPRWGGVCGTLEGWCSIRAKGAMLDYLRNNDHLSRWHRKLVKEGKAVAPKVISLDYYEGRKNL